MAQPGVDRPAGWAAVALVLALAQPVSPVVARARAVAVRAVAVGHRDTLVAQHSHRAPLVAQHSHRAHTAGPSSPDTDTPAAGVVEVP